MLEEIEETETRCSEVEKASNQNMKLQKIQAKLDKVIEEKKFQEDVSIIFSFRIVICIIPVFYFYDAGAGASAAPDDSLYVISVRDIIQSTLKGPGFNSH